MTWTIALSELYVYDYKTIKLYEILLLYYTISFWFATRDICTDTGRMFTMRRIRNEGLAADSYSRRHHHRHDIIIIIIIAIEQSSQ